MRFSDIEIQHLAKSWVAISLAFAILLSNGDVFSSQFSLMLVVAGFTVGLGFLLHEIGHKYMAQKYGCYAEFRAFNFMLVLAVLMSFLGFVFAAPGAVMIGGRVNRERNGKISLAGPVVNIILALLFLVVALIGVFPLLTKYGIMINAWLAAFNMIPFGNFDGVKILRWSKPAYFVTLGVSLFLVILSLSGII